MSNVLNEECCQDNEKLQESERSTREGEPATTGITGAAIRVATLVAVLGVASYVLHNPWVRGEVFDVAHLKQRFENHGIKGSLAFLVAAAVINAAGVPRLWISTAAGIVFGAVEGSIVALLATLAGCTANFFAGRYLLSSILVRWLPGRFLKRFELLRQSGFKYTLYLRLFPFTNATVTNLVCGACSMRYTDYIAASFVGYLPLTLAMASLGSCAAKANVMQFALGAALALVMLFSHLWLKQTGRLSEALEHDDLADAGSLRGNGASAADDSQLAAME